jgi:hypothetical protein
MPSMPIVASPPRRYLNWNAKTVCRILLLVAKMLTEGNELRQEIQALSNHITQFNGEEI